MTSLCNRLPRYNSSMNLDDLVCYCFHVPYRKLVHYCRREKPRVASQLSDCGGAGTGCGWCIPFLKKLFEQESGRSGSKPLDQVNPQDYAAQRAEYIRAGHGTPPPSAQPPPAKEP